MAYVWWRPSCAHAIGLFTKAWIRQTDLWLEPSGFEIQQRFLREAGSVIVHLWSPDKRMRLSLASRSLR
jgi:hypothetical protein